MTPFLFPGCQLPPLSKLSRLALRPRKQTPTGRRVRAYSEYVTIYSYQWHFGLAFSSPAAKSTENQGLCVLLQSRLTLRGVDPTADRLTECGTSHPRRCAKLRVTVTGYITGSSRLRSLCSLHAIPLPDLFRGICIAAVVGRSYNHSTNVLCFEITC